MLEGCIESNGLLVLSGLSCPLRYLLGCGRAVNDTKVRCVKTFAFVSRNYLGHVSEKR